MQEELIIKNFRALVVKDDCIIGAKGYNLYKYDIKTSQQIYFAKVCDKKYSFLSKFFLTRRFFRAEITNLYHLKNGSDILIAKKGIFKREKMSDKFIKCFSIPRGSRPMNLCITPNGDIFFGEYFSNFEKKVVNIYSSHDNGKTWNIVYTFKAGNINHIHGLFYDNFTNNIWVVTGDRENECIIGYTDNSFKSFNEVFRGGQDYRTCNLIFYEDKIIYVTDSQYIQNEIKCFDRNTLQIKYLYKIQGSGIYAGQNGDIVYVSSTIEPSKVNNDKYSHLYISKNCGENWQEIVKYKKDIWNKTLFQFGSIQFPRFETKNNKMIIFSGRALKKLDENTIIINNEE
jgi:hypothetical protein